MIIHCWVYICAHTHIQLRLCSFDMSRPSKKNLYHAGVTFIYDDLSWEAPDLRPLQRVSIGEHSPQPQQDIRRRFRQATDDFVESVRQMKVEPEPPGLYFTVKGLMQPVKLVPLSKFIARSNNTEDILDAIFVTLHFADVREEDAKDRSVDVYSSDATIKLAAEYYTTTLGTNSTFRTDSPALEDAKERPRLASIVLSSARADDLTAAQIYDLDRTVAATIRTQFQALQSPNQLDWMIRNGPTTVDAGIFFTASRNPHCIETNKVTIAVLVQSLQFIAAMYQSNVAEAVVLQQIVTEGLVSDSGSSSWSQFLTGHKLYDPRLLLFVWDLINRKDNET